MTFQAETFAKVLEGDNEGSDEKAIAAMGILNTLETIVTVMEDQPTVRLQNIQMSKSDLIGSDMEVVVCCADFKSKVITYETFLSLMEGKIKKSVLMDKTGETYKGLSLYVNFEGFILCIS